MNRRRIFDRKYLGRVAAYAAIAAAALGALFYLGYHMSSELRSGIDIIYARAEQIPRTITSVAYILKDETVLENPASSMTPAQSVSDGERVREGDTVAEVYTSASPATLSRIAEIREQIDFYESCLSDGTTLGDSRAASRSVADAVIKLRRNGAAGSYSSSQALKNDIVLGIREVGVLSGRVTNIQAQLTSLKNSLASERASLGSSVGVVRAPAAGYYFSASDGYESIFTSKSIDSLTYSGFADMLSTAENSGAADTSHDAGVLMNDFRWYVAIPTDTASAAQLTEGYDYTVTLENNASIPVTMEYYRALSDATDSVMIFKSSRIPENFDFTRSQEAEITYSVETLYRIPIGAVRMYEGQQGVLVLDRTKIEFRRIAVSGEESGYYLCEVNDPEATENDESTEDESTVLYPYLAENDIVIVSGTGLTVGMTYDPKGQ